MDFEWDEVKNRANISKHGISLFDGAQALLDPAALVFADARFDYGEPRFVVIGKIDGRVHVVVYVPREGVLRLISARKANYREQKFYADNSHQT